MVLFEEPECGVCLEHYSKSKHVPRVLYCNHTFCDPCLNRIAQKNKDMISIRCPVCRQSSCVRDGLTLQDALYVNNRLWNSIVENQEDEEEIQSTGAPGSLPTQLQCRPRNNQLNLPLPGFLKKMIFRRRSERILPGCNVQIKSWRRLSGEEMP
ncbi:RING finger protein 223 [Trichomycterus rosablanca]|uniref:RING finger protein 223 n=1 Tax=Trichomycterus rosablanca TaxID=2290929 RepID=UPI002F351B5E